MIGTMATSDDSSPLPAISRRMRLRDRILEALRPTGLTGIYWLARFSPLRQDGWLRSIRQSDSIDASGAPVPWITYPAIDFLASRLRRGQTVFEWGSGASTRWFAGRTGHVDSCEHDATWYERVKAGLPTGASIRLRLLADGERYTQAIRETDMAYDIVLIDGRRRSACAQACLASLAPGGVVVWDNTDRAEYTQGLELLRDAGFHRVDFWGMAPMLVEKSCTSVLFRQDNCLGV
jgi:hypothetical protein